jgi:hypothetical protein
MNNPQDINSIVLRILETVVVGFILLDMGVSSLNWIFRNEKLGTLFHQTDLALTRSMKFSVKLNIGFAAFLCFWLLFPSLTGLFPVQVTSSTIFRTVFILWMLFITWKICQRTEIRSKGIWFRGSAIRWKSILAYGWNEAQDTVLLKLEQDRNFFSGHKGGDFPIPIVEGDREEVAKHFNIYLEGKEKPVLSSK